MAFVLVIDDNDPLRHSLRATLERAGHRVAEAADGKEGLEAYRRAPADVVVCDLYMPEKDGLELIRELRRLDPAARVIAISGGGNGFLDALPFAEKFGAAKALAKPFEAEALLAAVGEVLRRS